MLIYVVKNTENKKVYVGATTRTMNDRKKEHKYNAFKRNLDYQMYDDMKEYGWDKFEWEVIERVEDKKELYEREKYWIAKFNAVEEGYNKLNGYGSAGRTISKDHLQLLRDINAKLTKEDVMRIKMLVNVMPVTDIAEEFEVSAPTIYRIKNSEGWKDVKVEFVC